MLFSKSHHNALLLRCKAYFNSTKSVCRYFSFKIAPNSRMRYLRSNILLASAALGLSVYVACKRKTLCETSILNDNDNIVLNSTVNEYDDAILRSRDLLQRLKDEIGIPGIVVGVSINGETVWAEGLGYADVENRVFCSADTTMRIASISKSITMAAVAKLWEQGKLNLDKPVQDYVPYFPSKTFEGKPVTITCRQLISHLGGIRHYDKTVNFPTSRKSEKGTEKKLKDEFEHRELYITEHFKDIKSSIDIFKDDPVIANPGSKFFYSTHGWTLVSAIVEAAAKEQFSTHITKLFKSLGMSSTYLDVNDILIYHRSRNYMKDKNGQLMNAPYVDNSYKWAGGGFLSTVGDLLQFGNAMLYSLQFIPNIQCKNNEFHKNEENTKFTKSNILNCSSEDIDFVSNQRTLPGYLNSKTVETMWTPVIDYKEQKYGMGWFVLPESNECMFCEKKKFCVYHSGSAIGASSVLLIVPKIGNDKMNNPREIRAPKGIIVTILTNLHSVNGLFKTASKIAQYFDDI